MAINDYRSIEFGIGIENGSQPDILYRLSINDSVKEALYDMKETFDNQFMSFPDAPTRFELTEKYASSEHLTYPLIQNELPDLSNLYTNSARIPLNDININDNLPLISYYFAIFTHNNGSKTIGVKRPTQFKGLLRKKIVKILNDSLIMVPDDLFKLDIDFDFFINETSIDILHPNGFLYISKIDQFTLQRAGEATNALALRINFINFAYIAPLVEQKITAARLISSIKSRPDLEDTNEQKLLAKCALHGVIINQQGNLIAPQDDHLITFLQILDRRLYDYDLLDNNTEQYLASSRKRTI
jgi:hypothetical protein